MTENYIIELEDGNFADFEQVDEKEVEVYGQYNFYNATFLSLDKAKQIIRDMTNANTEWIFFGDCITPKQIRKVKMVLESNEVG